MLTENFNQAVAFTANLHRDQVRKGSSIPYFAHLMAVSSLVLEHGGDEEEAIAGLLHDAIEDQGKDFAGGADGMRQEIESRFGSKVLSIVEACSDSDQIPKPPWRARKEAYISHLASADSSTLLVSCADKVHNARSICSDVHTMGDELWGIFKGGKDGTLWYYRALTEAFASRSESPKLLVAELDRIVTSIENVAQATTQPQ